MQARRGHDESSAWANASPAWPRRKPALCRLMSAMVALHSPFLTIRVHDKASVAGRRICERLQADYPPQPVAYEPAAFLGDAGAADWAAARKAVVDGDVFVS